jgi:hypothetical protein
VAHIGRRVLTASERLRQDYSRAAIPSYLSQPEKGAFYAIVKIIGRLAEALKVEPAD